MRTGRYLALGRWGAPVPACRDCRQPLDEQLSCPRHGPRKTELRGAAPSMVEGASATCSECGYHVHAPTCSRRPKPAEPPKAESVRFQPGDVVRCVEGADGPLLVRGVEYVVDRIDNGGWPVIGRLWYSPLRFELVRRAEPPKAEPAHPPLPEVPGFAASVEGGLLHLQHPSGAEAFSTLECGQWRGWRVQDARGAWLGYQGDHPYLACAAALGYRVERVDADVCGPAGFAWVHDGDDLCAFDVPELEVCQWATPEAAALAACEHAERVRAGGA